MKEDASEEVANSSIRPNSKASAITQDQLAKFRELQRRRLQVRSKTNNKRKSKGPCNFHDKKKDILSSSSEDVQGEMLKDSSDDRGSIGDDNGNNVSSSKTSVETTHPVLRKKKLHWGLDTKERWERKANM